MLAINRFIPRGQTSYNYNDIKKEKPSIIEDFSKIELTYPQTQALLEVIDTIQRELNTASLSEEIILKLESDLQGIPDSNGLIEKLIKAATHNPNKLFNHKAIKKNWFSWINYTKSISAIISNLEYKNKQFADSIKPYLKTSHRSLTPKQIIAEFIDFYNYYNQQNFFDAIYDGDIHLVKLFLRAGADINTEFFLNGMTALTFAVIFKRVDILQIFIDAKVNINKKDATGKTALMRGAERGTTVECLKMLIKAGAQLNNKDLNDQSAWMLAFKRGDADLLKELIEQGAKLDFDSKWEDVKCLEYMVSCGYKVSPNSAIGKFNKVFEIILEHLTIEQINQAKKMYFSFRDSSTKASAIYQLEIVEKFIKQAQEYSEIKHNESLSSKTLSKQTSDIANIFSFKKLELATVIINKIGTYNLDISTFAKARKYLIQQRVLDENGLSKEGVFPAQPRTTQAARNDKTSTSSH